MDKLIINDGSQANHGENFSTFFTDYFCRFSATTQHKGDSFSCIMYDFYKESQKIPKSTIRSIQIDQVMYYLSNSHCSLNLFFFSVKQYFVIQANPQLNKILPKLF